MIQLFDKFKNIKKLMTILFIYIYIIIIVILNYVLIFIELIIKILNI